MGNVIKCKLKKQKLMIDVQTQREIYLPRGYKVNARYMPSSKLYKIDTVFCGGYLEGVALEKELDMDLTDKKETGFTRYKTKSLIKITNGNYDNYFTVNTEVTAREVEKGFYEVKSLCGKHTNCKVPAVCLELVDVKVSDGVKGNVPKTENSGGSCDYYKVKIKSPTTAKEPYIAECNDVIEALNMTYAEANIFKELF